MDIRVFEPAFTTGPVNGEVCIAGQDRCIKCISIVLIGTIEANDTIDNSASREFKRYNKYRLHLDENPAIYQTGVVKFRKQFLNAEAFINKINTKTDKISVPFSIPINQMLPASLSIVGSCSNVIVRYQLVIKVSYSKAHYTDVIKNITMPKKKIKELYLMSLPPPPMDVKVQTTWFQAKVGLWKAESTRFSKRMRYLLGEDTASSWFKLYFEARLPTSIRVSTSTPLFIQDLLQLRARQPGNYYDEVYPEMEICYLKVDLISRTVITCSTPVVAENIFNLGTISDLSFKIDSQAPSNLSQLLNGFSLPIQKPARILPTQFFSHLEVSHEVHILIEVKCVSVDGVKQEPSPVKLSLPVNIQVIS